MINPVHVFGLGKSTSSVPVSRSILATSFGRYVRIVNLKDGQQRNLQRLNLEQNEQISCISSFPKLNILAVAITNDVRVEFFKISDSHDEYLKETTIYYDAECSPITNLSLSSSFPQTNSFHISVLFGAPKPRLEYRSQKTILFQSSKYHSIQQIKIHPENPYLWAIITKRKIIHFQIIDYFNEHIFQKKEFQRSNTETTKLTSFCWNGDILFCAYDDGRIWKYGAEEKSMYLKRKDAINFIEITKHHLLIHFQNSNTISWIDLKTKQPVHSYEHDLSIQNIFYFHNTLYFHDDASLLKVPVDKILREKLYENSDDLLSVNLKANSVVLMGQLLLETVPKIVVGLNDDSFLLVKNGSLFRLSDKLEKLNLERISTLTVVHSRDCRDIIVLGFDSGVLALSYLDDNKKLRIFYSNKIHKGSVEKILVDDRCHYVASIGSDLVIWFLSLKKLKPLSHIEINSMPICCTFSNISNEKEKKSHEYGLLLNILELVLAMKDGEVIVYDLDVHRPSRTQHWPLDDTFSWIEVKAVPRAPHLLLVINDEKALKISVLKGDGCLYSKPTNQWRTHLKALSCLDVGGCVATGSLDGKVQLRNLSEVNLVTDTVYAHPEGVHLVALNPKCTEMLSVGKDGTVITWSIPRGRKFACPKQRRSVISENILTQKPDSKLDHDAVDYLTSYQAKKDAAKAQRSAEEADEIQMDLEILKETYKLILERNAQAAEEEKLTEEELLVDLEAHKQLLKETDEVLANVRLELKWENLAKQLIHRRIKDECWNTMQEPIAPFSLHAFKAGFSIPGYIVNKISNKEEPVHFLSKSSQAEELRLNRTAEDKNHDLVFSFEDWIPNDSDYFFWKECAEDPEIEIYNPLKITTSFKRRVQMCKLAKRAQKLKQKFNDHLIELFQLKESELKRIGQMKKEIETIQKELVITDPLPEFTLHVDEKPESLLKALPEEIMVKRIYTKEEQEKLDHMEKERKIREAELMEDDAPERALGEMMGGTLDTRTEVEMLTDNMKNLYQEWFEEIPEEEMSEKQEEEFKVYTSKLADLEQAKVSRKKMLQSQLKTLKIGINETVKSFDLKLKSAVELKLGSDKKLYLTELLCSLLHREEVEIEFLKEQEKEHFEKIETAKMSAKRQNIHFLKYKGALEDRAPKLDALQAEEKQVLKAFKSHLNESGQPEPVITELLKIYKSRKTEVGAKMEECPDYLWKKLLDFRKQKQAKEKQVQEELSVQKSWQKKLKEMDAKRLQTQDEVAKLSAHLENRKKRLHQLKEDSIMLTKCKQGQLEMKKSTRSEFQKLVVIPQ